MFMQTGFAGSTDEVAERWMSSMTEIMLPVLEKSMIIAGQYARGCERDIILPGDIEFASKYCAMRTVGQTVGSMMPEIYDDTEDDSGEEPIEEVPEEECPEFVRYSGDDPFLNEVNLAVDMWDDWIPQSPAENLLKNCINKL